MKVGTNRKSEYSEFDGVDQPSAVIYGVSYSQSESRSLF